MGLREVEAHDTRSRAPPLSGHSWKPGMLLALTYAVTTTMLFDSTFASSRRRPAKENLMAGTCSSGMDATARLMANTGDGSNTLGV